jgi:acylphosphatase
MDMMAGSQGEATRAMRVLIAGRVQGVGYRAWCAGEASALGLSGWVRNRRGGEVEAVFSGPSETVKDMLGKCHSGPRWARVDKIEQFEADGLAKGPFEVRPTE